MKAVMLSIKPKWCELIASGEKTVEVRKTKPKLKTPFKCYIYCTKGSYKNKYLHTSNMHNRLLFWKNPNDTTITVLPENHQYTAYVCNGKVIGEFVCDEINRIAKIGYSNGNLSLKYANINDYTFLECDFLRKCQLSYYALNEYADNGVIYAWHISDLVIYDKPKELNEFCIHDNTYDNAFGYIANDKQKSVPLKKTPQSWCYVEELR